MQKSNIRTINNKEEFKLLNLSDDSKSLSDLDLPEIVNQRKRKVRRWVFLGCLIYFFWCTAAIEFEKVSRTFCSIFSLLYCRKTRSRTPAKLPLDVAKSHLKCKNLGLWTALIMIGSWLFIVSYIISVIHGEYKRLEVELEKGKSELNHAGYCFISNLDTHNYQQLNWIDVVIISDSNKNRERRYHMITFVNYCSTPTPTCVLLPWLLVVLFFLLFVCWCLFSTSL